MPKITMEYLEKIGFNPKPLSQIDDMFDWAETVEGYAYWDKVDDLINMECGFDIKFISEVLRTIHEMNMVWNRTKSLEPHLKSMTKEEALDVVEAYYD